MYLIQRIASARIATLSVLPVNSFKLAGKQVQHSKIFLLGGLEVLRKSGAWQAHRNHDAAGAEPESGAGGVLC
jgi:hypothetical protein